jgi:hypothetical protein
MTVPAPPLASLGDPEGERVPAGLPPVTDAHVHLFPEHILRLVWRWFDRNAFEIRYKLLAEQTCEFLFSRGVEAIVAMQYAHAPGIAAPMNAAMVAWCERDPRIIGLATVLPGEPEARAVLRAAFAGGLRGVKIHCHVQCVAPDASSMHEIYEECSAAGRPIVIHAGREPKSKHYHCDPYELCSADRIERVLRDYPRLRLCVPHMGGDEYDAYERLVTRYDHLWLDTAMSLSGFFDAPRPGRALEVRPDRVLYGTDFPNLPYAWDRELRHLAALGLAPEILARILGENCAELYRD